MKSERLDAPKFQKKYTAFSFAWLRRVQEKREVPVLIIRVDGFDVHYRTVREDGGLGSEQTIHIRSDILRPASKNEFKFVIERGEQKKENRSNAFEISLPTAEGSFFSVQGGLTSRKEAVSVARKKWGADHLGRIRIVNEVRL